MKDTSNTEYYHLHVIDEIGEQLWRDLYATGRYPEPDEDDGCVDLTRKQAGEVLITHLRGAETRARRLGATEHQVLGYLMALVQNAAQLADGCPWGPPEHDLPNEYPTPSDFYLEEEGEGAIPASVAQLYSWLGKWAEGDDRPWETD